MKLNRFAYEKLINSNIDWLRKQPPSLERDHIESIVLASANHEYRHDVAPDEEIRCLSDNVVDLREALYKICDMVEHDSDVYCIAAQASSCVSDIKGGCPHGHSRATCKDCPEIG